MITSSVFYVDKISHNYHRELVFNYLYNQFLNSEESVRFKDSRSEKSNKELKMSENYTVLTSNCTRSSARYLIFTRQ